MNAIVTFFKASYDEFRHHVSWPTAKELQQYTSIVFVATLIIAFAVFGTDKGIMFILNGLRSLFIS